MHATKKLQNKLTDAEREVDNSVITVETFNTLRQ